MLSLSTGIALRSETLAWWPDNAIFAADFVNRRYMKNGAALPEAEVLGFARASSAWDDNGVEFTSGQPRFTARGLILEPARQRLSLHPVAPINWPFLSGTPAIAALPQVGAFQPIRIASDGNIYARTNCAQQSLNAGDTLSCRLRYAAGSSGRFGLYVRDDTSGQQSIAEGPVGAIAANSSAAGNWSDIVNTSLGGGVWELTATITLSTTSSGWRMGCSPRSTTVGEYVDLYGGMNEIGAPAGRWIIGNTSSIQSQSADALTLQIPTGSYQAWAQYDLAAPTLLASATGPTYSVPATAGQKGLRAVWFMPG